MSIIKAEIIDAIREWTPVVLKTRLVNGNTWLVVPVDTHGNDIVCQIVGCPFSGRWDDIHYQVVLPMRKIHDRATAEDMQYWGQKHGEQFHGYPSITTLEHQNPPPFYNETPFYKVEHCVDARKRGTRINHLGVKCVDWTMKGLSWEQFRDHYYQHVVNAYDTMLRMNRATQALRTVL